MKKGAAGVGKNHEIQEGREKQGPQHQRTASLTLARSEGTGSSYQTSTGPLGTRMDMGVGGVSPGSRMNEGTMGWGW